MAKDKKAVLFYCDWIHTAEKLSDEQAGKLFKHLLRYVNDLDPVLDDPLLDIAFEPIKQNLKRDLKKYEEKRKKNSENARKRWEQEKANECDRIQTDAKHAVNDSVNDSVNVNDINTYVFNEDDEKFKKFLCEKFKINEQNQPRKFMKINNAIIYHCNQPEDKNRWFRDQCWFYFSYKEETKEKCHNLDSFLKGEDGEFESGGWNAANWKEKVKELHPEDSTVQPSKQTGKKVYHGKPMSNRQGQIKISDINQKLTL